ncbi:MAG: formate dehydrogenase accessory sulfurtransferase FdhD [Candidatus Thermoplasmatota archaeon]|nr:formate dehydrogenase accessory sulfurtransferase FdhD [Candidatus Thermoplasmatota archaeon]
MDDAYTELPLMRLSDGGASIQKETVVEEVAVELHALNDQDRYEVYSTLLATPTEVIELHAGHLYSEGYIDEKPSVDSFHIRDSSDVQVFYNGCVTIKPRQQIVTSSCGACNHPNLTVAREGPIEHDSRFSDIDLHLLTNALELLTHSMPLFQQSGGCHGTALFSVDGSIDHVSEDIGRHNAVDKTIGKAILSKSTTLEHSMLLLSGRCGWDIVAKCVRVGIPAIASLGAFSSAAVNLAREHNVTLYGFVTKRGAWKVGY